MCKKNVHVRKCSFDRASQSKFSSLSFDHEHDILVTEDWEQSNLRTLSFSDPRKI